MFRPSVLLLAAVMSGRAIYLALVAGSIPIVNAVIWFLVALPVSAVVLAVLRSQFDSHRRRERAKMREVLANAQHQ